MQEHVGILAEKHKCVDLQGGGVPGINPKQGYCRLEVGMHHIAQDQKQCRSADSDKGRNVVPGNGAVFLPVPEKRSRGNYRIGGCGHQGCES